ncbi:hypothetical protein MKI79_00665 [Acinetobacter sp. A3.8]|uniref:Uncharacterized protein n=1 Tax=Acinetobacter sedimenti TaxID=2919922 RepID=A0A9X1WUI1_9GAMM|nr:hypothetical protein [Acinetobacter sedimenti]MCJ8145444.1 hypothetical protein [Acinetobacter sedimenti]
MSSENSNKNLWIIIGVICIVVLAIAAYVGLQDNQPAKSATADKASSARPLEEHGLSEEQLTDIAKQSTEQTEQMQENSEEFAALVDDSLVEQPIAEDQALQKDEIAQLEEVQKQLGEQKVLLEQQHQDADKLLELKEQQLAELEAQLQNSENTQTSVQ